MAAKKRAQGRPLDGDDTPDLEPEDRAGWRRWLEAHHASARRVWLVYRKPRSGRVNLTYDDAVEEALCFGWIDSLPRKLDEARFKQLFTPRKAGSMWSAVNKERLERLLARGIMAAPGLAKIEAAKRDGSWEIGDASERLEVPDDLARALAATPPARERWDAFAPSARRGILWWIASAKTAPTREQRVRETARLAALGLRAQFPESRGK